MISVFLIGQSQNRVIYFAKAPFLLVSVNLKLLTMGVRKTIEFIKDMNKKKSMVENIVITLKLYFNNAEVEVCG